MAASQKKELSAGQQIILAGAAFVYRMRRRIATGGVVLGALFFGYHAFFGVNGVNSYQQKRTEGRAIEKRIADLQQQNAKLQQKVNELKSDPDAIEHEARERLHYARPGEVIWSEDQGASQSPKK
ncbi:MAG TPA: septum formation initiator family protein [Acidobacteriaceae bacterium]|nr:septum formation initiator family protein [Acidobacteriaceae bacterium]